MFPTVLTALILSSPPPADKPKPPPPSASVEVSARTLQLPALPISVGQARARYSGVKTQIKVGLGDLEKDLLAIYADPASQATLPPTLKVPRSQVEEVKFMVGIIDDAELERLTADLHQAWKKYVDFLVTSGLAEPTEDAPRPEPGPAATPSAHSEPPPPQPVEKPEDKEVTTRMARMKRAQFVLAGEARDLQWLASIRGAHAPAGSGEVAQMQLAWTNGNHDQLDERVTVRRKQMMVANREAPNLAAVWEPLAAHLNRCAEQLLDYDQRMNREPVNDPLLRTLRIQAKLVFLERFRENLWFCGNIWALMTSSPAPAPLKKLEPAPGVTVAPASTPAGKP